MRKGRNEEKGQLTEDSETCQDPSWREKGKIEMYSSLLWSVFVLFHIRGAQMVTHCLQVT